MKKHEMRIRKKGARTQLQIWEDGRWYSVNMDTKERTPKIERPVMRSPRKKIREDAMYQPPDLKKGSPTSGEDRTVIETKPMVSFLSGYAPNRRFFKLNMGTSGQMKILIIKGAGVGFEPNIRMKTIHDDSTNYTTSTQGSGLILICDGTYWYPMGTIVPDTLYSPAANAPGFWVVT